MVILAVLTIAVAVVAQPGCGARAPGMGNPPGPQPMELQGQWLGLTLATPDSAAARQLAIPPNTSGVVVTGVSPNGSVAAQAGVMAGDLIVGLDGSAVANLSNLYTLSVERNSTAGVSLELVRRGQPLSVVVPPAYPMPGVPMGGAAMAGVPMGGAAMAGVPMGGAPMSGAPMPAGATMITPQPGATPFQSMPAPAQPGFWPGGQVMR